MTDGTRFPEHDYWVGPNIVLSEVRRHAQRSADVSGMPQRIHLHEEGTDCFTKNHEDVNPVKPAV